MSTTLFSNASPFASALPSSHMFFQYDSDGDCIMTDAVTGLPITYGSHSKRNRASFDSDDSSDSRPSKRSRISSDDDEQDGAATTSTSSSSLSIKTPRAPVGIPADECPPAPKKAARRPFASEDHEDHSVLRNLAETMAEAVLVSGPPSPITAWDNEDTVPHAAATTTSSSNAAAVPLPPSDDEEDHWCVSVSCPDLALRLDMRHPRVILNLLRFISSYNELAPEDEMINLPCIEADSYNRILSHVSVKNPAPEFADEVDELQHLMSSHRCQCPDCEPENWSDYGRGDGDDEDEHDSDDDRDSRDGCGCEDCNPHKMY